jgi:hypothetical protein
MEVFLAKVRLLSSLQRDVAMFAPDYADMRDSYCCLGDPAGDELCHQVRDIPSFAVCGFMRDG